MGLAGSFNSGLGISDLCHELHPQLGSFVRHPSANPIRLVKAGWDSPGHRGGRRGAIPGSQHRWEYHRTSYHVTWLGFTSADHCSVPLVLEQHLGHRWRHFVGSHHLCLSPLAG